MGERVGIVYGNAYRSYKFSETHPFNPVRVELFIELVRECGLLDSGAVRVIEPRTATEAELQTIHDPQYIEAVKAAGTGALPGALAVEFGLGPGDNPAFPGMHESAATIVGGSLLAAELVFNGSVDHAFNPGGGLHHAQRIKASGFCVYNDAAAACEYLSGRGLKVAYVDVDAHHGDGVQWAFYDSPAVLTVSIHETGEYLFPGTGFVAEIGEADGRGFSVNLPVPPGCYDAAYLTAFRQVVPAILRSFRPEAIVAQCGCDGHYHDPLTHMSLTSHAYGAIFKEIHGLSHELCGGRLVALGGGGYDIYDAVPRIWTGLAAELAGVELDERIPAKWRKICRALGGGLCPSEFGDFPRAAPEELQDEVPAALNESLREIRETIFPFFNL